MRHNLKIYPEFFKKVLSGEKTFEVRINDRGYKVGDELLLQEWEKDYTGRELLVKVTYITSYMLQYEDFVVMAIRRVGDGQEETL